MQLYRSCPCDCLVIFFFFNDPATTEIYTLSLHDALPISRRRTSTTRACTRVTGPPRRGCRPAWRSSPRDRKSTRLNSSHVEISYAVFCLKKKKRETSRFLSNGRPLWF